MKRTPDALHRIDSSPNVCWCVPPFLKINCLCFGAANKARQIPLAFPRPVPANFKREITNSIRGLCIVSQKVSFFYMQVLSRKHAMVKAVKLTVTFVPYLEGYLFHRKCNQGSR